MQLSHSNTVENLFPFISISIVHTMGKQKFSLQGQTLNIFSFVGHMVCVVTTLTLHLHHESSHRQYVNKLVWLFKKKNCLQNNFKSVHAYSVKFSSRSCKNCSLDLYEV